VFFTLDEFQFVMAPGTFERNKHRCVIFVYSEISIGGRQWVRLLAPGNIWDEREKRFLLRRHIFYVKKD
jgi:hypothetical protein